MTGPLARFERAPQLWDACDRNSGALAVSQTGKGRTASDPLVRFKFLHEPALSPRRCRDCRSEAQSRNVGYSMDYALVQRRMAIR